MYVIAVYDMASERTTKMLKLLRRYLHWIQNSVFEGEISESQMRELEFEALKIMDPEYDSLIVFKSRHVHYMERQIIGREKSDTGQFL